VAFLLTMLLREDPHLLDTPPDTDDPAGDAAGGAA